MSKNSYLRRNGDSPVYQFLMRVPLKLLPRVKLIFYSPNLQGIDQAT